MLESIFLKNNFSFVLHLAAQAGVRHSFENPHVYINSNIKGFINILECCRKTDIKNFFMLRQALSMEILTKVFLKIQILIQFLYMVKQKK